jgi:hypothetical protein
MIMPLPLPLARQWPNQAITHWQDNGWIKPLQLAKQWLDQAIAHWQGNGMIKSIYTLA